MKHTVAPSREGEQREEGQSMRSFIGCDAHRKYSVFVGMDEKGRTTAPMRVEHERKELRLFLRHIPPGTDVAWKRPAVGIGWWMRSKRPGW